MDKLNMTGRHRWQRGIALFELLIGLVLFSLGLVALKTFQARTANLIAPAETVASQMNQAATLQARLLQASNNNLFDVQQIALNAWQNGVSFNTCAQNPLCANEYAADGYPIHNTQGGAYEMSSRNLSAVLRPDLYWTADAPAPLITGLCTPVWLQHSPVNAPNQSAPTDPAIAYTDNPGAVAPSNIDCGVFMNPQDMALPMSAINSYFNAFQSQWSVPYFQQSPTSLQIATAASGPYAGPGHVNPKQPMSDIGYIGVLNATTHAPAQANAAGAVIAFQNMSQTPQADGFAPASLWAKPGLMQMYTYTLQQGGANVKGVPNPQTVNVVDPQAWQAVVLNAQQTGKPVAVVDPSGKQSAMPSGYFEPMAWTAATRPMNGLVIKTWRDAPVTQTAPCGAGYMGPGITTVTQAIHAILTDNTQTNGMRQANTSQIIGSSGTCVPNTASFSVGCSYGTGACTATVGVTFDANGNPINPTGTMLYSTTPPSTCGVGCVFTDPLTGGACTSSGASATCTVSAPASASQCSGSICSATWNGVPGGGSITASGADPVVNPLTGTSFGGIEINGSLANTGVQTYGTVPVTTCPSNGASCSTSLETVAAGPSGITNGSGTLFTSGSSPNSYAPTSTDVNNLMAGLIAGSQYANGVSGSLQLTPCATNSNTCGIFQVISNPGTAGGATAGG